MDAKTVNRNKKYQYILALNFVVNYKKSIKNIVPKLLNEKQEFEISFNLDVV